MIFKTTLKDINAVAVAIDKLGKITSANISKNTIEYSLYGKAIEGLNAKQLALALSTQKLTPLQIEQIIDENNLIKTYGAEVLVKEGLISTNSKLLVSEQTVYAQNLQQDLLKRATNKEAVKEFIQKNLIVAANGEESASTILLNKALMDEAVERGILSKEKAAEILSTYGVVTADITEIGSKKGLKKATKELIASKVELSEADIGMIAGVAALVFTIYKCNKAVQEAKEKAQDLGSTFKETSSTIDDYKKKIEELYKTINDESSSIEDTTNARKSLLSIQDELIEKFGTEKGIINDVTEAIKGQTEALDGLAKTKWQESKNEFNDGGFWNKAGNFFEGKDNIQRMLDEYSERTIFFNWADYAGSQTKLTNDMVAKLENIGIDIKVSTDNLQAIRDFDSLTESIEGTKGATLALSGNAEEIYNKILSLQNLVNGDDSFGNLYDNIERHANSYKELTDTYKEFYNQYILYEKILTEDSDYADKFKDITDAYEDYQEAFTSGDETKIKEAADKYANILSTAMVTAIENGDSDVATYFENMYPTLKSIVSDWNFNIAFDSNTDDLQTKIQSVLDELTDENGRSLTVEEILGLGEENKQYQALISIARSYNMTLEEMIELLKQRKLVSAMDYQGLVSLFGQENVDKLSPEDLEIAYTIKNIGNITFEQLQAEIEETKKNANEPITFNIEDHKDQLDNIKSSISTLRSALESLNSGELDKLSVIDLMQEFPDLAPYIDLTADGFGNLSEGLSKLIAQQPDELISKLKELKSSLSTDKERQQVDLLIDSLQRLSSYGDSGLEAFATAIGSTWNDTANVIEGVVTQFENLAKVQEAVSKGLTMSSTQAAELAKIYPEILTNAVAAGNGQITLNEQIVQSILDGDRSIIDAQISKLEADKAELEAKKIFAQAQLDIIRQVGEGEGKRYCPLPQ